MSITLDTLTLPYDLMWTDEFSWTGASALQRYSLQGSQHIETSQITGDNGRTITLESPEAWILRSDLLTLHGWAQEAGKTMSLTLHSGAQYRVQFRHWEPPAVDAENIKQTAEPAVTDYYRLMIKLVVTPE